MNLKLRFGIIYHMSIVCYNNNDTVYYLFGNKVNVTEVMERFNRLDCLSIHKSHINNTVGLQI